ncbi:efflux RND transporter periplasmic adaptor subunit [Variovorax sp. J22P240]|uniref:efflux RND transporter periplasmic adaptor subunit n=1 Tax=unclassified Variovorax TaxID=663243 RepID=UPI002576D530|nr:MULTISPECIES: efflux RND transporter periplasmic adaptor subunit [unclassified Variovorax]MDL9998723.1 efflux RND transporter periplasmic adaptor subunit [Variovorax sp. J22P240]MDM0050773.1 efflux RND transporter periplasmic adaptor subunit [Variovorax sp. J22R115]
MSEQRHAALAIHPIAVDEDGDHHELPKRRQIVRRTRIVVLIVLALLAVGAARTVFVRMSNARALEAGTAERAAQYVKTALPQTAAAGQTLALPGTLQGFVQSPISARASGYLRRWTKDIGSRVEKGELLAEIETPEIDQQLSQAIAARQQAASGLELAKSTVARWENLRKKDVVSQQDLDERRSALAQSTANLAAADANMQRLRQTEGFKRVLAPFAGVITRRNVDVGDLIDAGGGGGGRALFMLAQTDPLRVYINVPQAYAQLIKAGQPVVVTQAELRGQSFKGEVARTSGAIDTTTRMMQVEVSLPNKDGTLLPGAYVQVSLPLAASQSLTIPANALIFRAEGTRVAVVDAQGRVHLRTVQLGRNYGETVEVLDGLGATDRLVLNPSDSLAEGDVVVVAKEPA